MTDTDDGFLDAIDVILERLGADSDDDFDREVDGFDGPIANSRRRFRQHERDGERGVLLLAPVRRGRAKPVERSSLRPSDLPPMNAPAGYRRDRRGTWRRTGGAAVPGAQDVTLATRWPYGVTDPVLVPDDEVRAHVELAWCRDHGELVEAKVRNGHRPMTVWAWAVPWEEWDDRARWPLGVDAPELAPQNLWGVDDVARQLGGVAPSTVTAYKARGMLPEPQFVLGGRPWWSAPIILHWLRRRPGG